MDKEWCFLFLAVLAAIVAIAFDKTTRFLTSYRFAEQDNPMPSAPLYYIYHVDHPQVDALKLQLLLVS